MVGQSSRSEHAEIVGCLLCPGGSQHAPPATRFGLLSEPGIGAPGIPGTGIGAPGTIGMPGTWEVPRAESRVFVHRFLQRVCGDLWSVGAFA